jgi:hypothetical protein
MFTLIAIAVAFGAGAYFGSANADKVKKGIAAAVAAVAGAAAYFDGFKGWFG